MAVYNIRSDDAGHKIETINESHIYESSRLGLENKNDVVCIIRNDIATPGPNPNNNDSDSSESVVVTEYKNTVGDKNYELSNHLGNVLEVINDKKIPMLNSNGGLLYFNSDIVSYSDYYPFGSLLPDRHGSSERYRYGFNGKEKDDEVKGEGNWQEYGMRMYDPRVGRFPNVDPLTKKYPELTPYQFASNRPIQCVDLDGLEAYFDNSGEFIKWGEDKSKTAPVILVVDSKNINIGLTIDEFKTRVYHLSGEGASKKLSIYYANVYKNAKAYGYHGKGFTESEMMNVLWQDKKYKRKDFLAGLPKEANTDQYQSYKDAYKIKDNFDLWDQGFKDRASSILNVEAGLVEDPTRGATNWGGGLKNYKYYAEKFGENNVITFTEGKFRHNFFNLNTGILDKERETQKTTNTDSSKTSSSNRPRVCYRTDILPR